MLIGAALGSLSPVLAATGPSTLSACAVAYGNLAEAMGDGWTPTPGKGAAEKWGFDGPKEARADYEMDLRQIVAEAGESTSRRGFERMLKKNKRLGMSTHVLDLFGSGFFVDKQELADSITGLRFGPFNRRYLPKGYSETRTVPNEVLGDIFNPVTWEKLDESFRKRGIPGVDFVAMRPAGGWRDLHLRPEQEIPALAYIIENVISRLNPGGRFYFTVPTSLIGSLGNYPELGKLASDIASRSGYKLILSITNHDNDLAGALVPK